MEDIDVYFNRFKEKLHSVELIDTLYVIWGYFRNMHFDKEVPHNIELPPKYNVNSNTNSKRLTGVCEWEFEILLFYSILFSAKEVYTRHSFRKFQNLSSAIDDLRLIRDKIDSSLGDQHDEVFREFFRLIHKQSPWQEEFNMTFTYRFFKVFSHPVLDNLIKKKTGLTTKELYNAGILMTGYFMNNFDSPFIIESKVKEIPTEKLNLLVKFLSIESTELIKKFKGKMEINNQFLYNFNPLRAHPLLVHKRRLYCPIPNYLFWKITNGIYYDIVDNKSFANAIGKSFEDYCGKVLRKGISKSSIEIIPEITYGKPEKKTCDWILKQENTYLFIECKASRLKLGSKIKLTKTDDIEKDINRMVDCVFQAYKSLNDVLKNKVENIIIPENSNIFIAILTLEEWFITLNPIYDNQIRILVSQKLEKNNIDSIIMKYPYVINAISLFETQIQVIDAFGIEKFYTKVIKNEIQELNDKVEFKELFISEFYEEIISFRKKP